MAELTANARIIVLKKLAFYILVPIAAIAAANLAGILFATIRDLELPWNKVVRFFKEPQIKVCFAALAAAAFIFATRMFLFERRSKRKQMPELMMPRRVIFMSRRGIFSMILPVLIVMIIVLGVILLFVRSPILNGLLRYNFVVSFIAVLLPLATVLRPTVLRRQTWKRLADPWLKWSGVSAVGVGGFGLIGLTEPLKTNLLKIALTKSQVPFDTLVILYLVAILLIGLASLIRMVGVASSKKEETHDPLSWFIPAFAFAWLGNLAVFVLFVDSSVLTLAAHIYP